MTAARFFHDLALAKQERQRSLAGLPEKEEKEVVSVRTRLLERSNELRELLNTLAQCKCEDEGTVFVFEAQDSEEHVSRNISIVFTAGFVSEPSRSDRRVLKNTDPHMKITFQFNRLNSKEGVQVMWARSKQDEHQDNAQGGRIWNTRHNFDRDDDGIRAFTKAIIELSVLHGLKEPS